MLVGLAACAKSPVANEGSPQSPALGVAAASPSGAAPASADADAPAARVLGQTITNRQLDELAGEQLKKLEFEHQKALYEARSAALEQLVAQRLVGEEARKKGLDVEAFMRAEVERRAPAVTDAEAKTFFDQNAERMGAQPFDLAKPRIVGFLTQQRSGEAAMKFLADLKAKAGVEVLLVEPTQPRVTVAAIGPSRGPASAPITIVEFSDFQ
ncbi:MAG: hypothetical protein AABZ30_08625 [Myxococcota bacterium]